MTENVTLKMTKRIKAPRSKVFQAWINPELMKRWYAPGTMMVPSARADPKVGGGYAIEMRGEMNGKQVNPTVNGVYKKIIADELISFTWSWAGDPSPETLVTVTFKEVDGCTEGTLIHERFPDNAARDRHAHGWTGCLENLGKFLEAKQGVA